MSAEDLDGLAVEFSQLARRHYDATAVGDWKNANKAVKAIDKVFRVIVTEGEVGRQRLLQLVDDADPAVVSMAAVYSMRYAPDRCQVVLRHLGTREDLLGFGARQAVERWNDGEWALE
ncbi:MAG TPA: hypothetical protein PLS53_16160 [Thermoanaerobaculaceae bacterium]|nr:hypothetical protein [Thermoanaerobaculaceae bacterium]HPS79693.1 hypothetical protein [Thermoanaerobaculaceae bacterium]